jgi:hypothetical protein
MECCFEGIKQTSNKNGIARVVHIKSWRVGIEGGMMKMIVITVASGMYGLLLWLDEGLAAGFAFGSFSSWVSRRLDNF